MIPDIPLIDTALTPFAYGYMTKAILVSTLIAATCGVLSCFLVLKGWSLMGDALAHAVVPGVAITYILGLPYALGALTSGLIAALSITLLTHTTHLKEDVTIGVIFTSFFALGLVLISLNPTAVSLQNIILGNILTISDTETTQIMIISSIVLVSIALKWKDLMTMIFDTTYARTIRMKIGWLHVLFFTLLSAATITALQAVGACLVIAVLITPGACAYLLSKSFGRMCIIAGGIGLLTGFIGSYSSYFLDINPGALIVCLQTTLFLILLIRYKTSHSTKHKAA